MKITPRTPSCCGQDRLHHGAGSDVNAKGGREWDYADFHHSLQSRIHEAPRSVCCETSSSVATDIGKCEVGPGRGWNRSLRAGRLDGFGVGFFSFFCFLFSMYVSEENKLQTNFHTFYFVDTVLLATIWCDDKQKKGGDRAMGRGDAAEEGPPGMKRKRLVAGPSYWVVRRVRHATEGAPDCSMHRRAHSSPPTTHITSCGVQRNNTKKQQN